MAAKKTKKKKKSMEIIGAKPASVVADGHGIKILENGDFDVIFIQMLNTDNNKAQAQVVSSIRISRRGATIFKDALEKELKKRKNTQKK